MLSFLVQIFPELILTQPNMPNLPGFDAMADTLEFVKNIWGGAKAPGAMPGMVMPTLSIEEINKQIADLKAVESWLGVNMNMLRTTIQALEVQAATFATLQAMGGSLVGGMNAGTNPHSASSAPAPEAWWNLLQEQFNQTVNSVMADQASAQASATKPEAKAAPTAAKKPPSRTSTKASRKRAPPDKP